MSRHLSTLTLHQLRYGELQGEALTTVQTHLNGCDACSARLGVQERERAAFVLRPVPPGIVAAAAPSPSPWPRWLRDLAPFALAAAAAAMLFVAMPALRTATSPAPEADRIQTRGVLPALEVWTDTGAGRHMLRDGEVLQRGDRVQLLYDAHGAAYVSFAGRDGAGLVEVYGTFPVHLKGLVPAPFALTLDDTPGDQELFVLTSDEPLDVPTVKAALRGNVRGVDVTRTAVHKKDVAER